MSSTVHRTLAAFRIVGWAHCRSRTGRSTRRPHPWSRSRPGRRAGQGPVSRPRHRPRIRP